MANSIHPFIAAFCAACKPSDRRPPWRWAEEHVQVDETSPMPGRWRSDASPWVRAVMEDFANNAIRDITVQCAAQSSKTQTVMCCACWAIAEDPGSAMRVTVVQRQLFFAGNNNRRRTDAIARDLKHVFNLSDAQAVKITRRITGRVRLYQRIFEPVPVKQ